MLLKNTYFLIFTLIFNSTYAQIRSPQFKSSDNPQCEIIQIALTDSMTFVFLKYTHKSLSNKKLCISEESFIKDVAIKNNYKLLNSVNIPYCPSFHEFDNENDVLYFSLTFNAIPINTKEIDICTDLFNFYGISLNKNSKEIDSLNYINLLEETPVKEKGFFYKEGKVVQFYIHKGLIIAMHLSVESNYGQYYTSYISIENYSNSRFDFFPDSIKSVFANENTIAQVLTLEQYIKKVNRRQSWNTFFVALGEYSDANNAGYSSINSKTKYSGQSQSNGFSAGFFGNTYGSVSSNVRTYSKFSANTTTNIYDATANYYARQNASSNVDKFINQQYQILESINQGYLKTNTIFPNQRLNGYVNIKYKKTDKLDIILSIKQEKYSFVWNENLGQSELTQKMETQKPIIKTNDELLIEKVLIEKKYTEGPYKYIESAKIGDIIKYKTVYGEFIFGVVTEIGGKNISFTTYPSIGTPLYLKENYNDLILIKY